jgi:hypothetical protein
VPRALDPVEAGYDLPLPPERPGAFSFNFGETMVDPTAEDVPIPEPKPVAEPPSKPAAAAKRKPHRKP